ncbi:hypothetical protein X771_31545 [Mesorhizobium sp. LSJC277A00]|nr:hypothetical protein X771_31545 [Mesorhizobium sp. LSJC277A00]
MTKVSITDEVYGGYCNDTTGKPIDNIDAQSDNPISFRAVPDDDTDMGSVSIVGTDAANVEYNDTYTFNDGNWFFFPKSKAPPALEVITQMKNFQVFSDQFIVKK